MDDLQILFVTIAGALAGALGALLGIGGGVFLVPFLAIVLGLPFKTAVAISLTTVIATSSSVAAGSTGRQLINLRLGMLLETATAIGGLAGGLTAQLVSDRTLELLFGVVAASIAVVMWRRLERRNVLLDPQAEPGPLGGRFFDPESDREVSYQVRRLPLALAGSFVAGNLSSLLGIGGGILKVPILNAWCGVPMRAAAATSAFMIGVTAVSAAPIYYAHGDVIPRLAAAGVIGVQVGSRAGMRASASVPVKRLKGLMAAVLLVVAAMMFWRLL